MIKFRHEYIKATGSYKNSTIVEKLYYHNEYIGELSTIMEKDAIINYYLEVHYTKRKNLFTSCQAKRIDTIYEIIEKNIK